MKQIKVLSVFGTRPEAIKMAPLALELAKREEFDSRICVTAQHREMLDSVLEVFGIRADYDLDLMAPSQTLTGVTTGVLNGLGAVLEEAKPDLVLVHGDTTTTFSAALAAFYARVEVGHVEAGLRTWDRYSPFPEEMNRTLVARLASLHFAPTAANAENLRREGVSGGVFVTGNTVIDAMRHTVGAPGAFHEEFLNRFDFSGKRVVLMTCHRRENHGAPMEEIFSAVRSVVERHGDVELIYPVHPSPVVREAANRLLSGEARIHLIEPLDAVDMHRLMDRSFLVLTDSGGLQEEAPALGKPVLVLRRETERPEAVAAGTVRLAGTERDKVARLFEQLLEDPGSYDRMAKAVNPYGDGRACRRIAEAIAYRFGLRPEPPEAFSP